MISDRKKDPEHYLFTLTVTSPRVKLSLILDPRALFSNAANVLLFVFGFELNKTCRAVVTAI